MYPPSGPTPDHTPRVVNRPSNHAQRGARRADVQRETLQLLAASNKPSPVAWRALTRPCLPVSARRPSLAPARALSPTQDPAQRRTSLKALSKPCRLSNASYVLRLPYSRFWMCAVDPRPDRPASSNSGRRVAPLEVIAFAVAGPSLAPLSPQTPLHTTVTDHADPGVLCLTGGR